MILQIFSWKSHGSLTAFFCRIKAIAAFCLETFFWSFFYSLARKDIFLEPWGVLRAAFLVRLLGLKRSSLRNRLLRICRVARHRKQSLHCFTSCCTMSWQEDERTVPAALSSREWTWRYWRTFPDFLFICPFRAFTIRTKWSSAFPGNIFRF